MAVFQVDWCLFYESTIAGLDFNGEPTGYYLKHFKELLAFIYNYEEFGCQAGPFLLELENQPVSLVRITLADTGDYLVTDPRVGSVFYLDPDLVPQLELKGLSKPLGVAVDSKGNLLVGNDGKDNIEVYGYDNGNPLNVFGSDQVQMPTAITIGPGGEIYVTDSRSHRVWVYDADYKFLRSIGTPGSGKEGLKFPVDCEVAEVEIAGQMHYEVFVADQGNNRIQVYDTSGNWLRSITFEGTDGQNCNWFTGVCEIPGAPPFIRLQALHLDSTGRLHVLDKFSAAVVMLDPEDGTFLGTYGQYGEGTGNLSVPQDVVVSGANTAVVTAGDGDRIEIFDLQ
jgi:DNA-binding beta-propeller fold protein YncE